MKIILLNGPPGCGKDFAGQILMDLLPKSVVMKFATEVKHMTHRAYGLGDIEADHFEDHKDVGIASFRGRSPRDAYIQMSEGFMKPLHGEWIFGHILKNQILWRSDQFSTAIITDSGFAKEAEVLIREFGADNVQLIRIHREGHDFSSDSRSYLDLGVQCHDVMNCGTPAYAQSLKTCLSSVGW